MLIRGVFSLVIALLTTPYCRAGQTFSCNDAKVSIDVVARKSTVWEDRSEAVVTVSRDGATTVLRYRNIDYIGGQCFNGNSSHPLVLYQAFCGGSGCKDLDNWGAIDAKTLQILMVPNDSNRDETIKLIQGATLPHLKLMSVARERRRLGIDVGK